MLYLTRKVGESVIINDDIEITVVEVRGRSIKLGFTFPPHVSVLRREIYERIQAENRAAAGVDPSAGAALMAGLGDRPLGERLTLKQRPTEAPAASAQAQRPPRRPME